MPFFNSFFRSVIKGTIPRFCTGKKQDIWHNSLYVTQEREGPRPLKNGFLFTVGTIPDKTKL